MATFEIEHLPNEVILNIFSYLSRVDLLWARLVCKRWLHLASLPEFLVRNRLIITKDNLFSLLSRLEKPDAASTMIYQNVHLYQLYSCNFLDKILNKIGSHIISLRLNNAAVFTNIQGKCPKLRELTVGNINWMPVGENRIAMDLNNFESLTSIDLLCDNLTDQFKILLLQQLTKENTRIKLQKLQVRYVIQPADLMTNLVRMHAETLRLINFYFPTQPEGDLEEWCEIFANLKKLDSIILSGNSSSDWLSCAFAFIPDEAPLKQLCMSGLMRINHPLILLILRKWKNTLENLELMFCTCLNDESMGLLWNLRNNLRVLNVSYCSFVSQEGLLKGIAKECNTKLRGLYLNDNSDLTGETISLLAERLPYLEVLSLENCRNISRNKSISSLFQHLTRLRKLVLNECAITDRQLLGRAIKPQFSILRLRGLETLSLRGCQITNYALTHAFKFKELRVLKLGYCHRISSPGIAHLVTNCPMLESLDLNSCVSIDDEAIMHVAKGLKRLRKLNINNCNKVTSRAIDYIIEHCKNINELCISGINSLDVKEETRRLLRVRPQLKL
ncbi:F-box/LRR-repeat protein 2 [Teleopsis dalmanni]|uniref:F-box/LRR-repeat protein 2 n=1 Tax=Teleopsis dalmanni TaxID=139649 RepID=UPI0018CE5342|nr:F-box/LRR-repeat protein 2 [Teleopsis dalmanni]XP_037950501.1 F-box/LRR-repeat protein 2 [Teleopsis dalmanni]